MKNYLIAFLLFLFIGSIESQEVRYPILDYRAYTKSLLSMTNPDDLDFLQTSHLFHQRNELNVLFSKEISLQVHNRNLIYSGQLLLLGNVTQNLENNMNDYADLVLTPLDRGGIKMVNALDRLFLEWAPKDWEVRVGRQRINWGMHSFWNPHDIFNAYSFVDFDYEERPGADAVLLRHYFNWSTNLQLAYSPDDTWDNSTIGLLFGHNVRTFDIQWLAAYDKQYYTYGLGLAGNIGQQALKIEASHFIPEEEQLDSEISVAVSLEASSKSGWIYGLSYLFDSKDELNPGFLLLNANNLSARELYPYEHSFLLSISKALGARWTMSWVSVVSIDEEIPLFLLPSMNYSIAQDWELSLVGQVFFRKEEEYRSPLQVLNCRIRYSY